MAVDDQHVGATTPGGLLLVLADETPKRATTANHYMGWLAAHGYWITAADAERLGYTGAIASQAVAKLTQEGYVIAREAIDGGGHGNALRYRATHTPDGTPIAEAHETRPAAPNGIQRSSVPKSRKPKRSELAVRDVRRLIPEARLALLRDPAQAPVLGAAMRVAMIAENGDEGASLALRDEHGRTWFAHLDGVHE